MYGLHHSLVRPFPCIYKTCEEGGNPSTATDILYHNPHLPGNDLVICKSWKKMSVALVVCGLDVGHPRVCVTVNTLGRKS